MLAYLSLTKIGLSVKAKRLGGELHEVPVSLFLQPVEVPQDGSMTIWHISHSSQFCIISKFPESTFSPIIQMINEDVKQDWFQY